MPRREPHPPPPADPAQAIASIRAEVGRLRSGLMRLEENLDALELAGLQSPEPDRQRSERYLRLVSQQIQEPRHRLFVAAGGRPHQPAA